MFHTYWRAYTGLEANSLSLNVISNNLANSNTVGFKRSEAEFSTTGLLGTFLMTRNFITRENLVTLISYSLAQSKIASKL